MNLMMMMMRVKFPVSREVHLNPYLKTFSPLVVLVVSSLLSLVFWSQHFRLLMNAKKKKMAISCGYDCDGDGDDDYGYDYDDDDDGYVNGGCGGRRGVTLNYLHLY